LRRADRDIAPPHLVTPSETMVLAPQTAWQYQNDDKRHDRKKKAEKRPERESPALRSTYESDDRGKHRVGNDDKKDDEERDHGSSACHGSPLDRTCWSGSTFVSRRKAWSPPSHARFTKPTAPREFNRSQDHHDSVPVPVRYVPTPSMPIQHYRAGAGVLQNGHPVRVRGGGVWFRLRCARPRRS
jgi:hypothetical protein